MIVPCFLLKITPRSGWPVRTSVIPSDGKFLLSLQLLGADLQKWGCQSVPSTSRMFTHYIHSDEAWDNLMYQPLWFLTFWSFVQTKYVLIKMKRFCVYFSYCSAQYQALIKPICVWYRSRLFCQDYFLSLTLSSYICVMFPSIQMKKYLTTDLSWFPPFIAFLQCFPINVTVFVLIQDILYPSEKHTVLPVFNITYCILLCSLELYNFALT